MRITRMFHHPCIAQMHAAFQDSKYVYFLLELLPGGDFFSYLQSSGGISEDSCRFYSASVISAFECLHSKKIAYRDLKPENMVRVISQYLISVELCKSYFLLDSELSIHVIFSIPGYGC
jgi:serine/threonine protein kinase